MEEIWKPVKGYDAYEVSNMGRVRSLYKYKFIKGKYRKIEKVHYLKGADNGHGYKYVTVCDSGKHKRLYVHRMVADAFLANPNNLPQINHKDENKANNNVANLEWCDSQYNMDYSFSKAVEQIDMKTGEIVASFKSSKEAGRQTGFSSGNISQACNGIWRYYNGYYWRWCCNEI